MTQTFKVGDKAKHATYGEVELAFGPVDFGSIAGGWVVKKSDGDHAVATPSALTPAAKFKVGDKVRGNYSGARYSIEAGPFYNSRSEWYATKDEVGNVINNSADTLTLVESADTYTHDGVTYDLTAKYTDGDDVWEFTGKRSLDGVPRVTCYGNAYNTDTIAEIADDYGPLTRIND